MKKQSREPREPDAPSPHTIPQHPTHAPLSKSRKAKAQSAPFRHRPHDGQEALPSRLAPNDPSYARRSNTE
jgi:hypothetical protein